MSAQKWLRSVLSLLFCLYFSACQSADQRRNAGIQRAKRIEETVLSQRKPPLKDFAVQRRLSIVNFGAAPNDAKNDLPAFIKAIQAIQKDGRPTELSLPQGQYIISSSKPGSDYCLRIDEVHDLIINGNNSELIIKNPDMGFLKIFHSQNIIVKDLAIDYDPLPFSQGYVQTVDQDHGSFDFTVAEGFPLLDMPHYKELKPNMNWEDCSSWGMLKDPENPIRLKSVTPDVFFAKKIEKVQGRLFRIYLQPPDSIRYFKPGDKYVHMARQAESVFMAEQDDQVTYLNVTIYTAPCMGFVNRYTSLLNIIGCKIKPRGNRWHTLDSDGIDTGGGRFGPWVEDCYFEGMADDGFCPAGDGTILRILEKRTDSVLKMNPVHAYSVKVGDQIVFHNPRLGLPIAQAVVTNVDYENGLVTFNQRLPELQTNLFPTNGDSLGLNDRAYNMNTADKYFVFKNNTIRNSRRWPIRMSAPLPSYGLIEGNVFEGQDGSGVVTQNDENWSVPVELRQKAVELAKTEKAPASVEDYDFGHVLIRKNTFREIGFSNTPEDVPNANVNICLYRSGDLPSVFPVLEDYVLIENTFENWVGKQAIEVYSGKNFVIQQNQFINKQNRYHAVRPQAVIYIADSRDIVVQDNTVRDDRKVPVCVEKGGQTQEIKTLGNSF